MIERARPASGACVACLRRGWLLAELGAVLDCNCRADGRLLELLALDDEELIAALGGRRRATLQHGHAAWRPMASERTRAEAIATVCRHDARWPRGAGVGTDVAALHVLGGVERLQALTARPVVAFVGAGARASDYGRALAASLARGLAAAGVTVASGLLGGIGPAALDGALELDAPAVAVLAGGLDTGVPVRRRALHGRLTRRGCTISELPRGAVRRRWSAVASERLLATLADVALVVESEQGANALAGARVATQLGRPVAAVPGRITSRASCGPHALLREGAHLVTCASDVLDLLCDAERDVDAGETTGHVRAYDGLDPILRTLLARVGAGEDTPGRLLGAREDAAELLRALGELELMGLLGRGDGGRYVLREPLDAPALRYVGRDQMEP